MLFAPILHARTRNNDFPSKLLVVPDDFSSSDITWARKYITQSTRYFELSGKIGRRVIFCNKEKIVTGVSIRIKDLYAVCNQQPQYDKVDRNRENYAFIGLVIPKSQICEPFDVSYAMLLDVYKKYMGLLWETPYDEEGITTTRVPYTHISLPAAIAVCDTIPDLGNIKTRCILDIDYAPLDSVCARVTMMMQNQNALGFCSDIPTANTVIESDFSIVTAKNAQQIIETLEREEQKKANKTSAEKTAGIPFSQPNSKRQDNTYTVSTLWGEAKKLWKSIPAPVKWLGGFFIIILTASGNKKQE